MSVDLAPPARVLAIGAHPDDIEFGCGATLAKWARAGGEVHLLVCTDGSKGTWDPDSDVADLVARRRTEQDAALARLGGGTVHWLGAVDGELECGSTERAAVCEVIRQVRPDVVLGHDPWKRYRLHPDHEAAGRLTIDAIVAARDPHFFAGRGGGPHRPSTLLLFEAEAADHVETVDGLLAAKVDALLCHRSQWRSTMGIDEHAPQADAQRAAFAARVARTATLAAAAIGASAGEEFKRITEL